MPESSLLEAHLPFVLPRWLQSSLSVCVCVSNVWKTG
jgi:hypothetical protein